MHLKYNNCFRKNVRMEITFSFELLTSSLYIYIFFLTIGLLWTYNSGKNSMFMVLIMALFQSSLFLIEQCWWNSFKFLIVLTFETNLSCVPLLLFRPIYFWPLNYDVLYLYFILTNKYKLNWKTMYNNTSSGYTLSIELAI